MRETLKAAFSDSPECFVGQPFYFTLLDLGIKPGLTREGTVQSTNDSEPLGSENVGNAGHARAQHGTGVPLMGWWYTSIIQEIES